ncbi:MAG: hypothetical protein M3O32_10840 [Actinomycetota bacterium]|nr:hypothetical protein [Actinomycetota bacterium]
MPSYRSQQGCLREVEGLEPAFNLSVVIDGDESATVLDDPYVTPVAGSDPHVATSLSPLDLVVRLHWCSCLRSTVSLIVAGSCSTLLMQTS